MHEFTREEKLSSLLDWVGRIEGELTVVREAIEEASTLERWNVSDEICDHAMRFVSGHVESLKGRLEKLNPYTRFEIMSKGRFVEALTLVSDRAEVLSQDGSAFLVPCWAVERAKNLLGKEKIRFKTS